MLSQFTVLLDACALYPAPLRDLLMHLAVTGLFRAKWTDQIHDEWIQAVLKTRKDLTLTQLTRARMLMDSHVLEAKVEGYEWRIDQLSLPDPDDRHVLAAAIECRASLIVTFNTRDFPNETIKPFGVQSIHPDDFILDQLELSSELVLVAVNRQKESLKNPAPTWSEFFQTLRDQNLHKTVEKLEQLIPHNRDSVRRKT